MGTQKPLGIWGFVSVGLPEPDSETGSSARGLFGRWKKMSVEHVSKRGTGRQKMRVAL